jgi:hypothetical protein
VLPYANTLSADSTVPPLSSPEKVATTENFFPVHFRTWDSGLNDLRFSMSANTYTSDDEVPAAPTTHSLATAGNGTVLKVVAPVRW